MTSKERAHFRSLANTMQPIFQIGKNGVSENSIKQIDDALEARELIKLRTLENSPESSRTAADTIAKAVHADVVQVIGSRFILYRESKDNKTIKLVK